MEKLEERVKSRIASQLRSAESGSTEQNAKRKTALEYYDGTLSDVPAKKGRSSVVSTDVANTIGWMLPGIMRVFTASDNMAEYEPKTPQDEEFAKQATDYINHVFWKNNGGYKIVWDATHDSLLQGNGIVKHYWDDSEECEYSTHSGLSIEQVTALMDEEGVEIVSQEASQSRRLVSNPETGEIQGVPVETFSLKIKRTISKGRIAIDVIKPECFLIDPEANELDEARFVAHKDYVTRSELINMGFDKEVIKTIEAFDASDDDNDDERGKEDGDLNDDGSSELVELYECYMQIDIDDDGVTETVKAYYVGGKDGGTLLEHEVWDDDLPFSDIPCEPVPHRWNARSVADLTVDVQKINTALSRQMLDNVYASSLPMPDVEEGSIKNMDALANPKFGQPIIRKKGSSPIGWQKVPFVAGEALSAIQHFEGVIEKRTGVSRSSMALDPEALQNQTATANQNQRDASYSKIELIARNQAELGWSRVFKSLLKLVVKHQDKPETVRLRDKWVEMDPRHWNASMDATINVGLGTGSRDRDMSMLANVMQSQTMMIDRMAGAGMMAEALDMLPKINRTLIKAAESAGIKNPEQYYPDFSDEVMQGIKAKLEEKSGQPSPEQQQAQAKMQADMQAKQMEGQMKAQQMQMDAELRREQMGAEMQLKREQMIAEIQLKREQMSAEIELKRQTALLGVGDSRMGGDIRFGGEVG